MHEHVKILFANDNNKNQSLQKPQIIPKIAKRKEHQPLLSHLNYKHAKWPKNIQQLLTSKKMSKSFALP